MAGSMEGKVVLISGTGGGQGREAALRFAGAGAYVVGCDVKEEGNRETAALVREAGGAITTMEPVDLSDPETARRWIEAAAAARGRIDVLYNNASAARFAPIESFSVEDWQFTVRNELDIVFYATRFAWPHLQKRGGVIINVASVAGHGRIRRGRHGARRHQGRDHRDDAAAGGRGSASPDSRELDQPGRDRVPWHRADACRPCVSRADAGAQSDQARRAAEGCRRRCALFLAGDDAAYITGTNIVVDGGFACC